MTLFKTLGSALFLSAMLAANAEPVHAEPGYKTTTLNVAHRDKPLDLHIWYPAQQNNDTIALGKNAIFKGVLVETNAKPIQGKHPLVLLSHGSGGNAVNIAWIAAELADRGMVVVATNHHGTTSRDSIPAETVKIWERPADLSAIADFAEKGGFGAIQIEENKMAAIGFSLGGNSVLSLAGARANKQKYINYCDKHASFLDCKWLASGGVDFTKIEPTRFELSSLDHRFKTILAIDPALAQAYDFQSIKEISIPVAIINLGAPNEVPAAVNASAIAPYFQNVTLTHVEQSSHFSFLGECTTLGKVIISASGEDPICSENGSRERSDIHAELAVIIGDHLVKHLLGK